MARKYLDTTGLTALWAKVKGFFVKKSGDTMTGDLKLESGSNNGIIFKESGYGDKFEIKPSFSGTGNTNYLAIKTATGDAGTDPDTTEKIRIRPSGQVEFLSNVNLYGYDLKLLTPSSSSNDSSDILYCYGNGAEKARIWMDNSPTDKTSGRLLVRAYKSDGTQIYSDRIPLLSDVTDRVARAGDTMSGQLSFSNTSRNIQIPARSISYVDGAKGNAGIYMPHTYNKDEWGPILCVQNKAGGSWSVGSYNGEELEFVNFTKANIDSSTNTAKCNWKLNPTNGFMGPWNGIIDDHNTNNTSDTWVPVFNGAKMQHRVIPRTIDGTSAVSFTRSHASVSYKEGLVCNRFGNVVTFAGYFSCGATIGANTTLYSGLPKPAGGKSIYFTWSGYDFYLHPTDGTIRTNGQIVSRTYVGTFTYVCA